MRGGPLLGSVAGRGKKGLLRRVDGGGGWGAGRAIGRPLSLRSAYKKLGMITSTRRDLTAECLGSKPLSPFSQVSLFGFGVNESLAFRLGVREEPESHQLAAAVPWRR